jgi:arylsulfatase A
MYCRPLSLAAPRHSNLLVRQLHKIATLILPLCTAILSISLENNAISAENRSVPNIVLILADDLGYGDVKCNNPEGKIATTHLDRLAAGGMRFTDAHSTSSVCTPTRYSVLTGRYNWRTRLQSGVLGGLSPPLIDAKRLTVAGLLRQHGYHTACVGKWHLGMTWARKPGTPAFDDQVEKGPEGWNVDYTRPIADGPTTRGFDYYFGISASLDMVPYTFLENDRVTVIPSVDKKFPLMLGKKPIARCGPGAAAFEAIDVLPTLTRKAVDYIGQRASDARAGRPFFLYLPLNSPHSPVVPAPAWQGRSGLNPYGDFVLQTDDCVGQILAALDRHHLADNTLVVFTSDNGCSPVADFPALLAQGHNPSYLLRGHKADIWDGGHRVPFLVRWPGKVAPGTTCDQLVGLVDLMATCAAIVGATLPPNAGEDSVSLLPALRGEARQPLREALVHHSINGRFAIRQGKWKLELCPGSGGWSVPRDPEALRRKLPPVQLYDLTADLGEQLNRQAEHPEVVARLTKLLERYVAQGRSTPGAPQKNDVEVDLWKLTASAPPRRK